MRDGISVLPRSPGVTAKRLAQVKAQYLTDPLASSAFCGGISTRSPLLKSAMMAILNHRRACSQRRPVPMGEPGRRVWYMKFRVAQTDILKKHDKDSLLLAKWVGLPVVWTVFLLALVVYLTLGIRDDTAPSPILFISGFVIALLGLVFAQRAVTRELKNRPDEPSRFWRLLGRAVLFVLSGLVLFCAAFFAALFGLSRLTSLDSEDVFVGAAYISVAIPIVVFIVPAVRWTLSVQDSGHTPERR